MEDNISQAFKAFWKDNQLPLERLEGKTILITGANGLVGSMLTRGLCVLSKEYGIKLRILALVRRDKEFVRLFSGEIKKGIVCVVIGDVIDGLRIGENVDFIIHGASITNSGYFIDHPVEVNLTNIVGTNHVLELAHQKEVESMVYLSTMEVYGFTTKEEVLTEENIKYLNPLAVRSCYPESKRLAENMCVAYWNEYAVPAKIIRLAQCFGYGVNIAEQRVFAEFSRCAKQSKDICLLTDGGSKRMYLDTMDAVSAILTVLLKGMNGEAYNAANKDTYCSVRDMAELVAEKVAYGKIKVVIQHDTIASKKFSPPHRMLLDTSKIEDLGWQAKAGLEEMYGRVLEG